MNRCNNLYTRLMACSTVQEEVDVVVDMRTEIFGSLNASLATALSPSGKVNGGATSPKADSYGTTPQAPRAPGGLSREHSFMLCDISIWQNFPPAEGNLSNFLYYVFERRFGWIETMTSSEHDEGLLDSSPSASAVAMTQKELVTHLDVFRRWLKRHQPYAPLMAGYVEVFRRFSQLPLPRQAVLDHVWAWFKHCVDENNQRIDSSFLHELVELLYLGLTDVWSAIRKAAASRLSSLSARHLELQDALLLLDRLERQLRDREMCSWQAVEGCVIGIGVILRHHGSSLPIERVRAACQLLFSTTESEAQLSIRNEGVKALSSAFETVPAMASELVVLAEAALSQDLELIRGEFDPHCGKVLSDLSDYRAQVLLEITQRAVRALKGDEKKGRNEAASALGFSFLAHQASSVRLTASALFAACTGAVRALRILSGCRMEKASRWEEVEGWLLALEVVAQRMLPASPERKAAIREYVIYSIQLSSRATKSEQFELRRMGEQALIPLCALLPLDEQVCRWS